MPAIPAFLLKKLYQAKSLHNEGEGYAFSLKNSIAPATIIKVNSLEVDATSYPVDDISFVREGASVGAGGVSAESPVELPMNGVVTVYVRGSQLPTGEHKIAFSVKTKNIGDITIDITDTLE